ncbi:winged helix-turn-helix domain-containing protein [Roseicyclus sp.]|uniref:winged helix-turn-helix domain-containing protein n=1 Tax=Roseicyclus sp. TaxID=1914329 RepID=UPI003F9FD2BE
MAEPGGAILDLAAEDILPRAAPVNCVADVSSPEVVALVARLGPWMPNLRSCATRAELREAVELHRPDVAILGRDFDAAALGELAAHVRTARIGVVVLQPLREALARFDGVPPVAEVEPIDPAAGLPEVVLRLRALLRRCRPLALSERRSIGDLVLDEGALTLSAGADTAPLTLDGFRLLGPMCDLPDHVWRREELLTVAYGAMTRNNPRVVDVKLNRTRRKLLAALGRDPVRTVRGVGYTLG